jgi:hypothetical protein
MREPLPLSFEEESQSCLAVAPPTGTRAICEWQFLNTIIKLMQPAAMAFQLQPCNQGPHGSPLVMGNPSGAMVPEPSIHLAPASITMCTQAQRIDMRVMQNLPIPEPRLACDPAIVVPWVPRASFLPTAASSASLVSVNICGVDRVQQLDNQTTRHGRRWHAGGTGGRTTSIAPLEHPGRDPGGSPGTRTGP